MGFVELCGVYPLKIFSAKLLELTDHRWRDPQEKRQKITRRLAVQ